MDFFNRPKYHPVPEHLDSREVPENLWVKCGKCRALNYVREFERAHKVCSKCGNHFRLSASERIRQLTDEGSFSPIPANLRSDDPLGFINPDGRTYGDQMAKARRATGLEEAIVFGRATINGIPVILSVMDFGFMGASMGSVVGEIVVRSIEAAVESRRPYIAVCASGGARMQEGIIALLQMAKTVAALGRLAERRLPFISILTDPTTGGVMASFASRGDIIIAEPGAQIGFAGPRVIEQATRQKLPADFQSAEKALEHGMIDMVVHRRDLKDTVARALALHPLGE